MNYIGTISDAVTLVIRRASRAIELMTAIDNHLKTTRDLTVLEAKDNEFAVYRYSDKTYVFNSASYTACVEWALKQPVTGAKDE